VSAVRAWLVLALLGAAAPASAHEVLHEVERGRAVAVRAWFPGGESLAHVEAEVYSPADPAIPHWKGRTDRNGWLAFVPDRSGQWRVRILDSTGHGLDTLVAVPGPGAPAPGPETPSPGPGQTAVVLRPVIGIALVAAIFGFLYLLGRRRRR
jgi:nickel transport protein